MELSDPLWAQLQQAIRAACLFMILSSAGALLASSSSIVGWYSVTVLHGNSSWTCGLVCADFYKAASVTVSADVDGKTLVSFSSPGWAGGEFTRHHAEPLAGASAVVFSFKSPRNSPDVTVSVECSPDLKTWFPATSVIVSSDADFDTPPTPHSVSLILLPSASLRGASTASFGRLHCE